MYWTYDLNTRIYYIFLKTIWTTSAHKKYMKNKLVDGYVYCLVFNIYLFTVKKDFYKKSNIILNKKLQIQITHIFDLQ